MTMTYGRAWLLAVLIMLASPRAGASRGTKVDSSRASLQDVLAGITRNGGSEGVRQIRDGMRSGRIDSTAWQVRVVYAECLNEAAFKVVRRRGIGGPERTYSRERIALISEAVRQYSIAERLAKTSQARAIIYYHRGRLLEVWGFPVDAYGWYRASLQTGAVSRDAQAGLARVTLLLSAPSP